MNKDTSTLIRAIRDQTKGRYKVISAGKHLKVIHASGSRKGRSVVDENGPVIISASPSESRNRELAVHRLIKNEVLLYDPWKGRPKQDDHQTREEKEQEEKQGRRLAIAAANNSRKEKTDQLRSELEVFLVKIGGSWTKYGFKSEFSRVILYWLKERGSSFGLSETGFPQQIVLLSKGNTIAENARMAIKEFMDEVNSQMNPRSYYAHLVGLSKRAKPTRQLPAKVVTTSVEGESEEILIPDTSELHLESKPSVWDFVSLAALHERSGLKWSMGLTIDEYAELQRAVGYLEALVMTTDRERGEKALEILSNFLVKMAEARFYTMANRQEADEKEF